MLSSLFGINEVESFISQVDAIFVERVKDPVLLVGVVEERANMSTPGKRHGITIGSHTSPPHAS
jgi:hypothetical protein